MKPASLPIYIPAIPDLADSPKIWREQVAPILVAIAEREKRNDDLYPYEKIAYNAIAFAQYNASKNKWSTLWEYLLDRQVLRITGAYTSVATPPPKPKAKRPTKPPKNKVVKPPKKKQRKSPVFVRFAKLRDSLISLRVFLWFAGYLPYAVPLCLNTKIPLRKRPDGERVKALLSYTTSSGEYASLKMYLPSSKKKYRMHPDVLRVLLDWSNPKRTRTRRKIESDKAKGAVRRTVSKEMMDSVLTDKWQDTGAICRKLNELSDQPIDFIKVSKILCSRYAAGEVCRLNRDHHELGYYSRIQATEFESQWLTLEMAYQLARSRGYEGAKNTFRKNFRFNYAAYGLEFRKEVPEFENSLLRWRDIQS